MVWHIDKKRFAGGELCFVLLHGISYEPSGVWESSVLIIFVSIIISIEFEF